MKLFGPFTKRTSGSKFCIGLTIYRYLYTCGWNKVKQEYNSGFRWYLNIGLLFWIIELRLK